MTDNSERSQTPPTPETVFLRRCTYGRHRIVCTGDLTEFQIAEARVDGRMFVDGDGLGYVLLPWELTTTKDKMREAGSRAPAGATVSESDGSNMANTLTEPARESSAVATSGPEATTSQGNRSSNPLGLLPCPFCGCRDVDIRQRERNHPNDPTLKIECRDCEASLRWYWTAAEAARDWNKRTPLSGEPTSPSETTAKVWPDGTTKLLGCDCFMCEYHRSAEQIERERRTAQKAGDESK